MQWPLLQPALLLRRYKRFLADVRLPNGEEITVHGPNTGAMTGCDQPGSQVWLSTSDNPKRKYRHTWELAQTAAGHWIGIHSAKANALVVEAIASGLITPLQGYSQMRTEQKYGDEKSRIDIWLQSAEGEQCFVEVKSVTLLACADSGLGVFPDAVSARGSKHLRELMMVKQQGHRAVLLFCVQHSGIRSVAPADLIDSTYADTFREALAGGVEMLAYRADINEREIALARAVPVIAQQAC